MLNHLYDFLEILMMALALGMDAFSLAVGVGLQGLSRRRAALLSLCIGCSHVVMTFVGIYAGLWMQGVLGQIAQWFGAFLLLGLGVHMAYTTLFQRETPVAVGTSTAAMVLFSLGVSIDALSVGFSLGLRSTTYGIVSAVMFGLVATMMCALGLIIGNRANRLAGMYGELIGAGILIGYGVYFMVH